MPGSRARLDLVTRLEAGAQTEANEQQGTGFDAPERKRTALRMVGELALL